MKPNREKKKECYMKPNVYKKTNNYTKLIVSAGMAQWVARLTRYQSEVISH